MQKSKLNFKIFIFFSSIIPIISIIYELKDLILRDYDMREVTFFRYMLSSGFLEEMFNYLLIAFIFFGALYFITSAISIFKNKFAYINIGILILFLTYISIRFLNISNELQVIGNVKAKWINIVLSILILIILNIFQIFVDFTESDFLEIFKDEKYLKLPMINLITICLTHISLFFILISNGVLDVFVSKAFYYPDLGSPPGIYVSMNFFCVFLIYNFVNFLLL